MVSDAVLDEQMEAIFEKLTGSFPVAGDVLV
jgi:hypothetical protein